MDNTTGIGDGLAGSPLGTTGTGTGSVRESATRGAQTLMDKAEAQARSKINATQKDIGLTLSSVASTLLSSSGQLRDEQQGVAGEYVGKAAEQIDRLANYIQNADPGEVADNLEEFARRRPTVFIGAAFALGVIGARFLKSSRRNIQREQRLASPGLTDREVPTLRAVETGGGLGGTTGSDLTAGGVYGDGGLSARAGMPASVDTTGPHGGLDRSTDPGELP
jgi:hypothetical protein